MLLGASRVAVVARATPELHFILQRALRVSAVQLGGGKRTVQNPPRKHQSGKPRFGLRKSAPSAPSLQSTRQFGDREEPTTRRRLTPMPSLRPDAPIAAPVPPKSFSSFPLNPALLTTLGNILPSNPKTTPVQSLSVPHFLSSKFEQPLRAGGKASGTVLAAETGSGKTLAYLLPLLHHLKRTDSGARSSEGPLRPRAVVVSPTHELTRQSTGVAKMFSHDIKLSIAGASDTAGRMRRAGGVDVLFSTGGTLRKMLGLPRSGRIGREEEEEVEEEDIFRVKKEVTPRLELSGVEWVVIDEADVLLGPDFAEETLSTLAQLPTSASLVLVSATLPPSLTSLLSGTLAEKHHWTRLLSPGLHRLPSSLSTTWITSSSGNLFADVTKEVRKALAEDDLRGVKRSKVLVFANADRKVSGLVETLASKGVEAIGWTGEGKDRVPGSQGALASFLTPLKPTPGTSARVLVTTSLLSRGLDFSNISTVILLDPPRDTLDFVHRAGRAGRAGRKGRVIVFGMGEFKDLAGRGSVGRGIKEVVRKPAKQDGNRQQPIRTQAVGGRMRL